MHPDIYHLIHMSAKASPASPRSRAGTTCAYCITFYCKNHNIRRAGLRRCRRRAAALLRVLCRVISHYIISYHIIPYYNSYNISSYNYMSQKQHHQLHLVESGSHLCILHRRVLYYIILYYIILYYIIHHKIYHLLHMRAKASPASPRSRGVHRYMLYYRALY
jgi:hypothetical protein